MNYVSDKERLARIKVRDIITWIHLYNAMFLGVIIYTCLTQWGNFEIGGGYISGLIMAIDALVSFVWTLFLVKYKFDTLTTISGPDITDYLGIADRDAEKSTREKFWVALVVYYAVLACIGCYFLWRFAQ